MDVFEFQSTLPVRGATYEPGDTLPASDISIHAPRAGSDQHPNQTTCCIRYISIHAPRAGSDQ